MASAMAAAFFPRMRGTDRPRSSGWWQSSTRDRTTGLLNAAALESVGAAVVRAAVRREEPVAALVVRCADDADERAGSRTVARVASALRETFAGDEVVARTGRSFTVLLPATDAELAVRAEAALSRALEADGARGRDGIALGVAASAAGEAVSLRSLLNQATAVAR